MKKLIYILIPLMLLSVFILGCQEDITPGLDLAKGPSAPAGDSNNGKLYLYEKVPDDWSIMEDGAWGKMTYSLSGTEFEFVFNGKGLEAGEEYTLIYYPDPWPGNGLICLGSGTANGGGNVDIKGSCDTGDLEDAKIWLVLSEDVGGCMDDDPEDRSMVAWNPEEYLFEEVLINFEDTSE